MFAIFSENGLKPSVALDLHINIVFQLNEEEKIIRPAIVECKKRGMMVVGPFPADGFFGSGQYRKFDGILAMYHDQGLPVLKYKGFGNSVNITLGLPFIRTSVDHGTATDLAGTGEADTGSMKRAIREAIDLAKLKL